MGRVFGFGRLLYRKVIVSNDTTIGHGLLRWLFASLAFSFLNNCNSYTTNWHVFN
jgi:hypothetical protein